MPKDAYDNLYKQFNHTSFNAKAWAKQAKLMGANNMIFTTKHHDGFCLWPSKIDWNHKGYRPAPPKTRQDSISYETFKELLAINGKRHYDSNSCSFPFLKLLLCYNTFSSVSIRAALYVCP